MELALSGVGAGPLLSMSFLTLDGSFVYRPIDTTEQKCNIIPQQFAIIPLIGTNTIPFGPGHSGLIGKCEIREGTSLAKDVGGGYRGGG